MQAGGFSEILTTYVVRLKLFRLNQASLPATPRQGAEGVRKSMIAVLWRNVLLA